jgi:hypothetical protein
MEEMKATTNMRRITKGHKFFDGDKLVTVLGFPQKVGENKIQIPVMVEGATRPSRRTFDANKRVALV